MPVAARRSELLRRQLERFTRTLAGVEEGEVRALHRARVGSRRLRELVPLLQLEGDSTRKLGRRLKKVTSRLGGVRELDVLLLLIDELSSARPAYGAALRRIRGTVDHDRDEARAHLSAHAPTSDMRRIAGKLDRIVAELDKSQRSRAGRADEHGWRWAVEARIAHRSAGLSTAMSRAGAVYLPERLHDVRIALKKLRYAAELAAAIDGRTPAPGVRALKRAQDLLGRMHDLQVLIDRARQLQASLSPPNLAVWRELDALVVSLEDECRRLHGRYVRGSTTLAGVAERLGAKPAPRRRRAG
jgi:CHAD domain-containing protein